MYILFKISLMILYFSQLSQVQNKFLPFFYKYFKPNFHHVKIFIIEKCKNKQIETR